MSNYPEIIRQLKRRLLLAGPLFLAGVGLMVFSPVTVILGIGLLGASALLLAPTLSALAAEATGSLFFPEERFDRPQPIYGIPAARRQQGLFEEAIAEYEKLVANYPEEIRPHEAMIDIALLDLRDPDRALAFFQRGVAALSDPESKEALARYYAAAKQRHVPVAAQEKPMLKRDEIRKSKSETNEENPK